MNNSILLSVAGGGKTTRLLQKIKELMEKGLKKDKILIISFTNSTVNNIKNSMDIPAYTLHSFLYKMLKNNKRIIESNELFVKLFVNKYPYLLQMGIYQVTHLVDSYFINRSHIDLNLLCDSDKFLNGELLKLIKDIEQEKYAMKVCGFNDIIHEGFQNQYSVLEDIKTKFDYFLLDEAQDLSKIQLQFTYKMIDHCFSEPGRGFFIVGDPKQSIYDFQDSCEEYYNLFIDNIKELCYKKNLPLKIENNSETYRFGGEILEYVNKRFQNYCAAHNSNISQGKVHFLSDSRDIEPLVRNGTNGFMILYNAVNSKIVNLQNNLHDLGYKMNSWIKYDSLIEHLEDVMNYKLSQENWFKVKILQGPFIQIKEPNLELLIQNNCLESTHKKWFDKLNSLEKASDIMKFLSENLHIPEYNLLLFKRLYELSHNYYSFNSFILNLPDRLMLTKNNTVEFSTVHNAKGLEHDNVLYLSEQPKPKGIYVNLQPFFFSKTPEIYGLKKIDNKINREYVALTRAKKNLYIFSPES